MIDVKIGEIYRADLSLTDVRQQVKNSWKDVLVKVVGVQPPSYWHEGVTFYDCIVVEDPRGVHTGKEDLFFRALSLRHTSKLPSKTMNMEDIKI